MKFRKISIGILFALALSCTTAFSLLNVQAADTKTAAAKTVSTTDTKKKNTPEIKLNKTTLSLEKNKKYTLKATVKNAANAKITWKSSNKKVAAVSKKGVVTTKKKGSAVITAKINGTNVSATCKVTVKKYVTMKVKTTGYCNCSRCCGQWAGGPTASGTKPKQGRTIAVDRNLISLGTKVEIGNKMYVAEDTGSAIKGKKIDIYYSSHNRAMSHGVKYQNIKVYM